ncbi:MAG: aromatic ring-opening dioxygenase LigA [Actinomycetota bacterium]
MANSSTPVRLAGIISLVLGAIFVLAGATTWALVTSELSAQRITVSDDAPFLAGDHVNGPFSAYAETEVIDMHASDATDGRTYAELGGLVRQAEADGDEELAAELQGQRTTVQNASFLRASLFTSVVAYGVSALVIGLGVILILQGLAFNRLAKTAAVPAVTEPEARHAG